MNIRLFERLSEGLAGSLSASLRQLSVLERCLLGFGGTFVLAVLAYQFVWSPAVAARDQLLSDQPRIRMQLARMTQQADEAQALKAVATAPRPSGQALLDSLKTSLVQRGLPNADLTPVGNGVRISIQGVRFSRCITWLDQVRRDDKLQVSELQASAAGHPGEVNLTAILRGPPAE